MANPTPSLFTGPALAWPPSLDRMAERWARLPWRMRAAIILVGAAAFLCWHVSRVNSVKAAMGNLHHVWIAQDTITPGGEVAGKFVKRSVPGVLRPETAISDEPSVSPVLTIVAGTVATSTHFEGVDRALSVPAGHRAVAIATGDADLFAPGSRVDLWDLTEEDPKLILDQLIVVSVKAERVIVGVPESSASLAVQRAASNNLRVTPAGADSSAKQRITPTPSPTSTPPTPIPSTSVSPAGERPPRENDQGTQGVPEQPSPDQPEARSQGTRHTPIGNGLPVSKPP